MDRKTEKGRNMTGIGFLSLVLFEGFKWYGHLTNAWSMADQARTLTPHDVIFVVQLACLGVIAWGLTLWAWEPAWGAISDRWERRKLRKEKEDRFKEVWHLKTTKDCELLQELLQEPVKSETRPMNDIYSPVVQEFVEEVAHSTTPGHPRHAVHYSLRLDSDVEDVAREKISEWRGEDSAE